MLRSVSYCVDPPPPAPERQQPLPKEWRNQKNVTLRKSHQGFLQRVIVNLQKEHTEKVLSRNVHQLFREASEISDAGGAVRLNEAPYKKTERTLAP
jgi:hypothetical protein